MGVAERERQITESLPERLKPPCQQLKRSKRNKETPHSRGVGPTILALGELRFGKLAKKPV
jgi:hypothetical protein